jgi:hypothetical protein
VQARCLPDRSRRIRAATLLLLALLVVMALAARAPAGESSAGELSGSAPLKFPDTIGVLDYMGERLGVDAHAAGSYAYRAAGLALDIDVYASPTVSSGDSASLSTRYDQAKQALARTGRLQGAKLLGESTVPLDGAGRLTAREALFSVNNPHFAGRAYLWVGAVGSRVLQMRLEVGRGFEEDGQVSRSEVLEALGEVLEHAPVVAAAAAPPTAPTRVAILWDPSTPHAEEQLWTVYLFTRAAQAAKESETRTLPLGERIASFEEEVRARRVAVNVFRTLARQDSSFRSAYFSDLDQVDEAGFLREYVWRYLHAPSWDRQPEGLKLHAFDLWRSGHLLHHHAVTYGRISLRLATQ